VPGDWAARLRVSDWPALVASLPPDWPELLELLRSLPPGWQETLAGLPHGWAQVVAQVRGGRPRGGLGAGGGGQWA
jgi:hypothetical protein